MYHPLIIADYVIATSKERLTPLQVIKLVYISHGYTLALTGKPLITEKVEAWRYGPVIPSLYKALKRYGGGFIPSLCYCGTPLEENESIKNRREFLCTRINQESRKLIDQVLDTYGELDGRELLLLTHKRDTPWTRYYKEGVLHIIIPNEAIKRHYDGLLIPVQVG